MIEHADYPHQPGTLYDCAACEDRCFCKGVFECVYCAIKAEAETASDWFIWETS